MLPISKKTPHPKVETSQVNESLNSRKTYVSKPSTHITKSTDLSSATSRSSSSSSSDDESSLFNKSKNTTPKPKDEVTSKTKLNTSQKNDGGKRICLCIEMQLGSLFNKFMYKLR